MADAGELSGRCEQHARERSLWLGVHERDQDHTDI